MMLGWRGFAVGNERVRARLREARDGSIDARGVREFCVVVGSREVLREVKRCAVSGLSLPFFLPSFLPSFLYSFSSLQVTPLIFFLQHVLQARLICSYTINVDLQRI